MGGSSAKLKWWLCGIKPAARAWEEDCCFHPEEAGMGARQGGADDVPHCVEWNSMRGS